MIVGVLCFVVGVALLLYGWVGARAWWSDERRACLFLFFLTRNSPTWFLIFGASATIAPFVHLTRWLTS